MKDFSLENVKDGDKSYLVRLSQLQTDNLAVIRTFIQGATHSESFEIPEVKDRITAEEVDAHAIQVRIPRGNQFCTGILYTVSDGDSGK